MLHPSGPRPRRVPDAALAVPVVLVLALGLAGAAPRPGEQTAAAVVPAVEPVPDVTFVPLAPAPDPTRDGDGGFDLVEPSGPGPLEPGERPHPWTLGDDPELDGYWSRCEAGSGFACDLLFDAAPVGSDYERFGLTCGDRPDVVDCADLDLPAP